MVKRDEVLKVAMLAKLEFTEPELEQLTTELNGVLSYIDQLQEVDVRSVAPLENVNEFVETTALRADVNLPSLSREEALSNAPRSADGYFLVPKVIEQTAKKSAIANTIEEDSEEEYL